MRTTQTRIALFGENVSKSLSPFMHNDAFRQLGLPYTYEAISVAPEDYLERFKAASEIYRGLNITIPYKETTVPYLDRLSTRARKLEAVNTVLFHDSESSGENTDVDGLLRALRSASSLDEKKRAFILGAGGAARATVEALYSLGVREFTMANRSPERRSGFRSWFDRHYSTDSKLKSLADLSYETWKNELDASALFVNAAPLEACNGIPFFSNISFPKGLLVVDWVYAPKTTPWIEKGERAKGTLVHGYKLLLYQGMKSFEIWTGKEAPERIMEQALLKALS